MKKILSTIFCIALICMCFSSCSTPNAEMTEDNVTKTVEAVSVALKKFDTKALDKYVDSSTLNTIIKYAESKEQFSDLGKAIFANLQLEITEIDLENSTVTVSVLNKDLRSIASNFANNLKSSYSGIQLLSKLNDDSFLDSALSDLCEGIDEAQMSDTPVDVQLSIRQGNGNLVLSFDETAEDSVSGGALSAIKNIYQ